MFPMIIKFSLRTLTRDRLYSGINIIGITLAIATALILGLYLYSELSYDRYHVNHERIFRIANTFQDYDTGNQRRSLAKTSPALGAILARDNPEIESYVRLRPYGSDVMLQHEDQAFYWPRTFDADDTLFSIFTHDIVHGDAATALLDPFSVAISETVARVYFGTANPVGETLLLEGGESRTVTLVFADQSDNTHLKYDVLFSYNNPARAIDDADVTRQLFGVNTYTYVLMPENYDPAAFNNISRNFFQRYMEPMSREGANRAWNGWLQPLASIHLGEELLNDEPKGSRYYLYGFAAVVVFTLLIAAINYMNLATAGHAKRSKQIGVRKIFGESRFSMLLQFVLETLLLVLVSLFLGTLVVELALNETSLTGLFGELLSLSFVEQPEVLLFLLAGALLFTVLAGLYPAFHLSSFLPLAAMSGGRTKRVQKHEYGFRELLLLLQFTISIGVITCTVVMVQQMRLLSSQALGFDSENRILVTLRDAALIERIPEIQDRLLGSSSVVGVTQANSMMGQEVSVNSTGLETNDGNMERVQMGHMAVGDNFVDVMDMQLVAGRNFSREVSTDPSAAVLVNQALVDYMQWDDPIGKTLSSTWDTNATVIGVVDNFNFRSLHTVIEPFFLYQPEFNPDRLGSTRLLVVHVDGEDVDATLDFIRDTLVSFGAVQTFEYQFLDDALAGLYLSESRLMYLIGLFAGICIAVTCLGLFGLTTFATEQRTKEIGIRRVLGASHLQVVTLLFQRVLLLVVAAAVLAALIVYPVMDAWLAQFAYRIDMNPLAFAVAAVAVLLIAFATVAAHTLRVASLEPVLALRYE